VLKFAAEVLDYGYPQILSPDILKLYITQSSVKSFIDKVRLTPKLFDKA
jgi:hypothetical protein